MEKMRSMTVFGSENTVNETKHSSNMFRKYKEWYFSLAAYRREGVIPSSYVPKYAILLLKVRKLNNFNFHVERRKN